MGSCDGGRRSPSLGAKRQTGRPKVWILLTPNIAAQRSYPSRARSAAQKLQETVHRCDSMWSRETELAGGQRDYEAWGQGRRKAPQSRAERQVSSMEAVGSRVPKSSHITKRCCIRTWSQV